MLFAKLKKLIIDIKDAEKTLAESIKEAKKLAKENKQLLSKVETAEKRGGVLLLSELNEELISKLQSLTDDNVVIIFLENDGSRIEIRRESTNYKKLSGRLA